MATSDDSGPPVHRNDELRAAVRAKQGGLVASLICEAFDNLDPSAEALIYAWAIAVVEGDSDVAVRLPLASRALFPENDTKTGRLAHYVKRIEGAFRAIGRGVDSLGFCRSEVMMLAVACDDAFKQLKPERLLEALLSIEKDDVRRAKGGLAPGGLPVVGFAHAAAQLAIEVNAFQSATGDYDADVPRLTERLRAARTPSRRKRNARP